jgi:hypothetical protein
LTGNLINDATKIKIREYMRPRKRIKDVYELITDPEEENQSSLKRGGNIDVSEAIKAKIQQYQTEEAEGIRSEMSSYMKSQPGETLIFSRVLGHLEIPHSHKWIEAAECWVCDRHRYSVMILSKTIAEKYFVRPTGPDLSFLAQKIKNA